MNQPMYYYRDGSPITQGETNTDNLLIWGRLHSDPEYKRVAETTLPDGTWISTVWLGLDHGVNLGQQDYQPLIFETMVFESEGSSEDHDQVRYATMTEALAGHDAMVAKWMCPGAHGYDP